MEYKARVGKKKNAFLACTCRMDIVDERNSSTRSRNVDASDYILK